VLRRLHLIGASPSTPPAVEPITFPAIVYTTAPDPTEWMSERERRYHQSTHFNR
jgi:hypothetical protein